MRLNGVEATIELIKEIRDENYPTKFDLLCKVCKQRALITLTEVAERGNFGNTWYEFRIRIECIECGEVETLGESRKKNKK